MSEYQQIVHFSDSLYNYRYVKRIKPDFETSNQKDNL